MISSAKIHFFEYYMIFHIIVLFLSELYVFIYSMGFDEMLHVMMPKKSLSLPLKTYRNENHHSRNSISLSRRPRGL